MNDAAVGLTRGSDNLPDAASVVNKVPFPAVESSQNFMTPPSAPLAKPPWLVKVPLPAVELL
jgi:hypothetical protein